MEQNGFRGIHPSAKKLWRINGMIGSGIIMILSFVVFSFTNFWALIPGALQSVYLIFIHPELEYKQWLYKITEQYVDYTHGIFFTKRTIIPISRIQHLDIRQGPIQKQFSLSNIIIFTAGQSHEIVAVLSSEAQSIVDSINMLILKEGNDGKV